jgi:hypothetical protein
LPDDLKIEAEEAVATRNYLAHRYMRERAMFLRDPEFCQKVADELANVQSKLDGFEERLSAHMRDLGIVDLTDDELDELGLSEPPSPDDWFDSVDVK